MGHRTRWGDVVIRPLRRALAGLVVAGELSLACGCNSGGGGGSQAAVQPGTLDFEAAIAIRRSDAVLPTRLLADDAVSFRAAVNEANAAGCGVEIAVSGDFSANATLTARCPDPDQLGIRVVGPARIEGELRSWCDGADCAWVSLEGLEVTNSVADAFECALDGRLAILDSSAHVTGAFDNVLTSHDRCWLLALSVSGSSGGLERAPTVAIVHDSRATILGRGEFLASETTHDAVVFAGGSPGQSVDLVILGHVLNCRAGAQHAIDFEPLSGGSARVGSALNTANCPADLRLGAGETAIWHSYRDSIPGMETEPTDAIPEVIIDDISPEWIVELPVPIPAWVDGVGAKRIRVRP